MYWKKPIVVWEYKNAMKEMMYYQYLPIKLSWYVFISIEKRIEQFEDLIEEINTDFIKRFWFEKYQKSNIYLTIKRQYIKPWVIFNRPWWHSDWFWTDDINYIWSDCIWTVFNFSDFTLSGEENLSLVDMEKQVKNENDFIFPDWSILLLDQYSIHRVQDPNDTILRTFVKISFSDDIYDLQGNSHNYEIDYNWDLRERKKYRNVPQITNNPPR